MNGFEQVALGGVCLARGLRAGFRPERWGAWLPLLLARLAIVTALAACAHPALSWAMAPLLRALAGEDALRYPQAFAHLAPFAARADLLAWALIGLPCAGRATRAFAAACGAPVPRVRGAVPEALLLIAAGLPAVLFVAATQTGLGVLAGFRMSAISRLLVQQAGAAAIITVQAATLYVVAEIVLRGANALEALAAIPRSLTAGFLPALVVLVLLALLLVPFAVLAPAAAAGRWHDLPEAAVVVAALRAVAATLVAIAATAAATLAWLAVLAESENRP